MPSNTIKTIHRLLGLTMGVLVATAIGVSAIVAYQPIKGMVDARLLRTSREIPWKVINAQSISSGATLPGDTHVVIHLPNTFETISREILLGHRGKSIRYWGYCFPENFDPKTVSARTGFPGLIFLSEREREVREEMAAANEISLTNLPTSEKDLNDYLYPDRPPIRHQLEVFKPGSLCYVMSDSELPIGLDPDDDRLNNRLERSEKTDPNNPDTDGDGIIDGIEFTRTTSPTLRDSDLDGIIDGLEDRNWNGRIDYGETDPRTWDSDHDELCDGICRIKLANDQYIYMGEDENLNGTLDEGETDPLLRDTDGDGYSDHVEYLKCIAEGTVDCPKGLQTTQ